MYKLSNQSLPDTTLRLEEAASPITTLSLPQELIGRILELAVEGVHPREHQEKICRALVCKSWSVEARVLLWRKVVDSQSPVQP